MRYLLTLTCLLTLVLSSCKKSGVINARATLSGTYKGTYQKTGPTYQMPQTANVTLRFSSNKWSGDTDISMYPGLCNGTFEVKNDKVTFVNACVWPAILTPGDILGGEFTMTQNGSTITLLQIRGNTINTYKITRQ